MIPLLILICVIICSSVCSNEKKRHVWHDTEDKHLRNDTDGLWTDITPIQTTLTHEHYVELKQVLGRLQTSHPQHQFLDIHCCAQTATITSIHLKACVVWKETLRQHAMTKDLKNIKSEKLLPDAWTSEVTGNQKYDVPTSSEYPQWGDLSWSAYKDDCMGCVKCDCHAKKETPMFDQKTPKIPKTSKNLIFYRKSQRIRKCSQNDVLNQKIPDKKRHNQKSHD